MPTSLLPHQPKEEITSSEEASEINDTKDVAKDATSTAVKPAPKRKSAKRKRVTLLHIDAKDLPPGLLDNRPRMNKRNKSLNDPSSSNNNSSNVDTTFGFFRPKVLFRCSPPPAGSEVDMHSNASESTNREVTYLEDKRHNGFEDARYLPYGYESKPLSPPVYAKASMQMSPNIPAMNGPPSPHRPGWFEDSAHHNEFSASRIVRTKSADPQFMSRPVYRVASPVNYPPYPGYPPQTMTPDGRPVIVVDDEQIPRPTSPVYYSHYQGHRVPPPPSHGYPRHRETMRSPAPYHGSPNPEYRSYSPDPRYYDYPVHHLREGPVKHEVSRPHPRSYSPHFYTPQSQVQQYPKNYHLSQTKPQPYRTANRNESQEPSKTYERESSVEKKQVSGPTDELLHPRVARPAPTRSFNEKVKRGHKKSKSMEQTCKESRLILESGVKTEPSVKVDSKKVEENVAIKNISSIRTDVLTPRQSPPPSSETKVPKVQKDSGKSNEKTKANEDESFDAAEALLKLMNKNETEGEENSSSEKDVTCLSPPASPLNGN